MYYFIIENNGVLQYVASETPPEMEYRMLTQEEYEEKVESLCDYHDVYYIS